MYAAFEWHSIHITVEAKSETVNSTTAKPEATTPALTAKVSEVVTASLMCESMTVISTSRVFRYGSIHGDGESGPNKESTITRHCSCAPMRWSELYDVSDQFSRLKRESESEQAYWLVSQSHNLVREMSRIEIRLRFLRARKSPIRIWLGPLMRHTHDWSGRELQRNIGLDYTLVAS